ncbi:DNA-binding protein [Methanocalculus chunghsingensis]|uniref:DNA-binding protein n=1 Tax=Methanocalculus chunghsingensis TaxID=156457 RepID=A0A8J7WAU1_9EURY|nr:metal-dependent transcriptional regulator [Methanocalculus chunghsingensis]MBR1369500.1 DNA-binding protein [Methanocalculus chunghsingensis]
MSSLDEFEITPGRAEYLKFILEAGGRVTTMDIARSFGVSPSTGTKVIKDLAEAGLLVHEPYSEAILTENGYKMAQFLERRHKILSLLFSHYGFTPGEACAEVKKFEYYVSREAINRICASCGHPTMSVCGRIDHDEICGIPE